MEETQWIHTLFHPNIISRQALLSLRWGNRMRELINYYINIDYLNYPYEVISGDASEER